MARSTTSTNHVSAVFQAGAFAVATCALIGIFYKPFMRFKSYDNGARVEPYISTDLHTTPVYVSFQIHNFVESDIIRNLISIEATVSFVYDPMKVSRDEIETFAFDEATVEKIQTSYRSEGELEVAAFDIQVRSKMDFNFKNYPLDDHNFWFTLKNNSLPIEKFHFVVLPGAFQLGYRMTINNCRAENVHAQTGYITHDSVIPAGQYLMRTSRAVFDIDCNSIDIRHFMRHFLSVFLPMYMIFFITLFSFSFGYSEHVTDVPGIAAAGVPALFAYRFVIETISPNVSYFMVSDYLFFLYLSLSLLAFLSVSWALNAPVAAKKAIIISLYAVMLVGCACIVWFM